MPAANTNTKKKQPVQVVVGANDIGKLPPQAPELEESVLGALMIDRDAFNIVSDTLRPESFYEHKNGIIFEAIRSLAIADKPIDVLSVSDRLVQMGKLEEAGGLSYLSELTLKIASSAHLHYHSEIVARKALARDLIAVSAQIVEKGYDETNDVQELLHEAEGKVFELSQRQQKRDVRQIDPVIQEAFDRIEKASKNEGSISGIPSGFHELDKMTSGWQESNLIIIAARPAMGKTAFVLSMAKNMAVQFGVPTAVFSLEMSDVELVNRLIMNVCEIEGNKIKSGKMSRSEWNRMETKVNELKGAPIYLDDTPQLSVLELQSKARKLKREKNIGIIIIDYLQLMNANGMNFGSREQEVSIISRHLKGLAKELKIPVIALSQLNRGVEARTGVEGKKPQLSDLRESGAIEQDADMVCFIHRPEYYHIYDDGNGNDLRGIGQLIVAKHRSGGIGEINLRFRAALAKFQNMDEAYDDSELYENVRSNSGATSSVTIGSKMNGMEASDAYADPDGAQLNGSDSDYPF